MSGQQDRWDELDESHQLDPREATLDLSRLIERMQQPRPAGNGSGSGKHAARSSREDPAAFADVMGAGSRGVAAPQDVAGVTLAPGLGTTTTEATRDGSPAEGAASAGLAVAINGAGPAHDTGSSGGTGPVHGFGGAARTRSMTAVGLTDSDVDDDETRAVAHSSRYSLSAPELAATAKPASTPTPELATPPKVSTALPETGPAKASTAPAKASTAPAETPAEASTAPAETSTTPSGPSARPPRPGSLADLRQRLEHLPLGHPSSPYHVDGERKPQPPRLKHLELAPAGRDQPSEPPRPAVSPGPPAAYDRAPVIHNLTPAAHHPAPAAHDPAPAAHDPAPAIHNLTPAAHRPAPTTYDPAPAAHDPAPTTYDPEPAADRRAPGRHPAPTAGHRHAPGHDDATLPHRVAAQGGAPERPANADLPRLTQPQLRIAEDVYDRFRALEGRSIFGSYTEGGLTARMRDVERQLVHGHLAPDTDQRALLGQEAFRARLADQIRRYPDRAVDLLARSVPGALSYTFVFDADHYAEGTWLVQEALQDRRFQLLARKNSWNSPEHKRVVTMWHDPESGLRFEVQFHTRASLDAQRLARASADLIASPRIPRAEAQTLRSDLAATWAALSAPPGNTQIGDYRRPPNGSPRS